MGFLRVSVILLSAISSLGVTLYHESLILFLLGSPLFTLCVFANLRYALAVLQQSAQGSTRMPVLEASDIASLKKLGMMPYYLFIFVLYLYFKYVTGFETDLVWIISVILLPAGLVNYYLSQSLSHSLNPIRLLETIAKLGMGYWIQALFLMAMIFSHTILNTSAEYFLAYFILFYGSSILTRFMGRHLYNKREAMGFTPNKSPEQRMMNKQQQEIKKREAVLQSVHQGPSFAVQTINNYLEGFDNPQAESHRVFEELCKWDKKEAAILFGEHFHSQLTDEGKVAAAELIQQQLIRLKNS